MPGIIQSRMMSAGSVLALQKLQGFGAVTGHHDIVAPFAQRGFQQMPGDYAVICD